MTEILILSFDTPRPGAPRTHGTFEERWLKDMVPLWHLKSRRQDGTVVRGRWRVLKGMAAV
jgi:hypothetical protein